MADKGSRKTALSPRMPSGPRTYQNRAHKLATLFVMTAGSANATQFSTMFIVYGGAPFLLAYLAFLGCVAFPVLRLESSLVQFAGDGNRGIFSTVPFFIGLGYSMTTYALAHAVADTVPLSDALALLLSWTKSFDWHHDCPGGWMTRNLTCHAIRRGSIPCKLARERLTQIYRREQLTEGVPLVDKDGVKLVPTSPYEQWTEACIPDLADTAPPYDFRRHPIWEQSSYDVTRAGPAFAIAALWLLVFAIAHRGLLRLKTFFYAFVLLHLASTLMLLVRASTLAGATRGLRVLMLSNWSSVTNLEMWSHALYVSLESVGVTGTIYMGIERLSCFKNRFQEDVMFVLVADTASKGIGTVVSFLFLGHLSHTTGIGVHMLVDADFNFIVSITPQAVSLVPHPEFWSRVHSLWVVSMMLPKFLIVPDIIMEVLSVSYPPILINRRATHFVICVLLFLASIASSFPGGAKVVAVVSQSQSNLRFLLLVLEVLVILQFYGVRKLSIDSRIMTSEEPGGFINFCWTSVTPVTVIALLSAKLIRGPLGEKRYPPFVEGAILWLEVVQVSFIPVYAVVLMLCTRLSLRDCLVPLPTWTPVNWELSMLYRQHLVAEGLDARQLEEKETASPSVPVSPTPSPSRPLSPLLESTSSSSGLLGTHLILTTEAKISPATSDWRYDSSDEGNAQPPVKWRSPPDKVVPRSGTFHKSLSLSAVWRAVRFNAASPKSARTKVPSHAPSHAPSPTSTPPHAALFVRDTSEVLATLPLVPRSDAGPTAPAVSPSPPLPANRAAREDSELLEELPVDSYVQVQADRAPGIPQQIQPPPQVLPSSCGQLPDAAAPSAVDTHGPAPEQQLAIEEEQLPPLAKELPAFSTARTKGAPESGKPDLAAKPLPPASGHGGTASKGHQGHRKLSASESHRILAQMEASTAPKTENGLSSCGVGALSPTSPLLPTTLPTSPGDIVFPPEQAPALKRRPESSSKRLGKKATTPVTAKGGEIKSPPEKTRDKNGAPHGPAASTVPPKTEDHRSSHDGGVLSPTTPLLPISTVLPTSPGDAVSPPEPAPPLRRRTGSGLKRLGKKAVAAVSSKGGDIKSPPEKTPGKKGTSHAQAMAAKSRKKTAMTNTLSPAPDVMSPAHDKASKAANQTANQAATAKAVVSDGKTASRRPSVSMAAAVASEKKAAPISPGRKIMGPRHKTRERIRSGSHTPKEKAPVKRAHSPKPAEAKPSALGFSTATPPAAERGKEAPTTTVTPHASKTKRRKTRGQTFTHKGKLHDDHAFSKAESSKASEGAAIASPTEGGQSLKERPPTLPLGSSLSAVVGEMEDLNRTGDKLLEQLASLLDATSPPRQPGRDLTRTCDPTTSEPAIAPASTEFRTGVREPTSPPSPSLQAPATTEQYDASTANALDSGSRVDAHPRATPATVADDVSSVLVDRSEEQAELLKALVPTNTLEAFVATNYLMARDSCFDVDVPARVPVADDQCGGVFSPAKGLAKDNAEVDRALVAANMPDGYARDGALTLDSDANVPLSSVPADDVGSDVMGRTKDDDESQADAAQLPLTANEVAVILHALALDTIADVSRASATMEADVRSGAFALTLYSDANAPLSSVPADDVGSDVTGRTKDDDENQADAAQLPLTANETAVILHALVLDSVADVSRPSATMADDVGSGAVGLVTGEAKDQDEFSQRPVITHEHDAPAPTDVAAFIAEAKDQAEVSLRQAITYKPEVPVPTDVTAFIAEAKDQAEVSQRQSITYRPEAPAPTNVAAPDGRADFPPSTSAAIGGDAASGGVERAEVKVEATDTVEDRTSRLSRARRSRRKRGSRKRSK